MVSFRPFFQGQCPKDLPRHYMRSWKRELVSIEHLLGRQPVESVVGAIGPFLQFISLIEAKPHHLKGISGDMMWVDEITDNADVLIQGQAIPF